MQLQRIGIFGASGYAGIELCRLVAAHGGVQLAFAASERHVGVSLGELAGIRGELAATTYVSFDAARARARECALVLLATPAEISRPLATELVEAGVRVVDLSGAFRMGDETVYGLTEVTRGAVRVAKLVANPGCYPTAATLPLVPLVRAALVTTDGIVVDAVSGASGAGRRADEHYSLVEMHDNVRAYKVLVHPHQAEIAQAIARAAGAAVDVAGSPRDGSAAEGQRGSIDVTFLPKLLPIPRGILATTTTRLAPGARAEQLLPALRAAYAGEPFVEVCERPEAVDLHRVIGTNVCAIAVACDAATRRVVLVSAIDNLVKGAAGQALQNANLMLGLPETTGLLALRRHHP